MFAIFARMIFSTGDSEYGNRLDNIVKLNNNTTKEIIEEVIWYRDIVKGVARAWKYELAGIVAKNFRCKYFFYGKKRRCVLWTQN